jgi:hypothetical protein
MYEERTNRMERVVVAQAFHNKLAIGSQALEVPLLDDPNITI